MILRSLFALILAQAASAQGSMSLNLPENESAYLANGKIVNILRDYHAELSNLRLFDLFSQVGQSPPNPNVWFGIQQHVHMRYPQSLRDTVLRRLTACSGQEYYADIFAFGDEIISIVDDGLLTLDFDKDGKVDLVMVQQTYFGPSSGWHFMSTQAGQLNWLYDNSCDLFMARWNGDVFQIAAHMGQIDMMEPTMILSLEYDTVRQCWSIPQRHFFGPDCQMVATIAFPPTESRVMAVAGQLHANDALLSKEVLVEFRAGARLDILSGTTKAYLVRVSHPDCQPNYAHGMDDGTRHEAQCAPGQVFHCGWIARDLLDATD